MISVIIPLYNAENTILATLDSVKNQEGDFDFEILVINDGSTDKSAEKVQQFIDENPQLKIQLIHQENKGVSWARNVGLKLAKGEWIAFLDSDDVWLSHKTKVMMKVLTENSKIDFLASFRNNEFIGFPYRYNNQNLTEITLRKFLIRYIGQTSTAIFRRKVLGNTGYFDENQRFAEDANYWLRISEKNKMFVLGETLVITGSGKKSFGESGLSGNLPAMEKGFQKNLKEMLHQKRILTIEYFFFYLFFKLKYIIRIIRARI
ncbi:hypothetical protein MASR1M29_21380 [Cloacibacterium normanense]